MHLIDRAAGISARHPRLCSLVAGAMAACGFAPLSLWPLTLAGIACLIELTARAPSARRAFLIGWFFGFGLFTVGDNWIATAFTYQAEMPAWLGWIAVLLLSLYLSVFPGLATFGAWWFAQTLRKPDGQGSAGMLPVGLALAPLWIITEWVRAWLFTGFAWNPLGVALLGGFASQGLALVAPWTGTYGLSGLLVLIGAALRSWARMVRLQRGIARLAWVAAGSALIASLTLLMVTPSSYLTPETSSIRYTLVQPDIRQEVLDNPRFYEAHFQKLAGLTRPQRPGERRVVFWPESGMADYLRDGLPPYLYQQMTYAADPVAARKRLGRVIGPYGLLMTGAVDIVVEDGKAAGARNTVTMFDGDGDILASYAKAHLVPYGEYLALRWLLEPLGASRLVAGTLDFWSGPGPRTFDFGQFGEAGVQICYEIIFSGQVVDPANRPDYIFNPSNDGWFGPWGPPQHLAQARLRAIEEGLPVLRSTTTGISAVIDADGIVRAHVPRHRAGRLDGLIPAAKEATLFAHYGNALPLSWAALLLIVSAVALRRGRS